MIGTGDTVRINVPGSGNLLHGKKVVVTRTAMFEGVVPAVHFDWNGQGFVYPLDRVELVAKAEAAEVAAK